MSAQVYIYGLFDKDEKCLYVGQTTNLKQRELSHRRSVDFNEMRELKRVSKRDSSMVERATILEYKRSGQAEYNSTPNGNKGRKDLRAVYISKDCHARFLTKLRRKGLKAGFVADMLIGAWANDILPDRANQP